MLICWILICWMVICWLVIYWMVICWMLTPDWYGDHGCPRARLGIVCEKKRLPTFFRFRPVDSDFHLFNLTIILFPSVLLVLSLSLTIINSLKWDTIRIKCCSRCLTITKTGILFSSHHRITTKSRLSVIVDYLVSPSERPRSLIQEIFFRHGS